MAKSDPALQALKTLFGTGRDPVCGVRDGEIVFANDAARVFFGQDVTGKSVRALFPGLELSGGEAAASLTLSGQAVTVQAVPWGGLWVLTILRTEIPASLPSAALSRMRVAAASLRLAMDALIDPESEDPYVAALYHSYYSLIHGVQQVSDASALSREEMEFRPVPVDLGEFAAELAESVAFYLRDLGISIRCQAEDWSCPVMADRDRLEQLLLILLSNSLHRLSSGGEITLTVRRSGRKAMVQVSDNGPGMSEEDLRRAFTVRDDREALSGPDGAGMGLYIAQGIARLHGGSLLLYSREGEGTRACLSLPLTDRLSFRDDGPVYSRGPRRILTELCDLLQSSAYRPRTRE